jgi:hypothetical protein
VYEVYKKGAGKILTGKVKCKGATAGRALRTLKTVTVDGEEVKVQKNIDVVKFMGVDKQAVVYGILTPLQGRTYPAGYEDRIKWYMEGVKKAEGREMKTYFPAAGSYEVTGWINLREDLGVMGGKKTIKVDVVRIDEMGGPSYLPLGMSDTLWIKTFPEGYAENALWTTNASGEKTGWKIDIAGVKNEEDELAEQNYRVRLAINGMLGPKLNKTVQPFEVLEVVISEDSEDTPPLYIDAETRQMPEVTFEFNTDPEVLPSGKMKAEWFLEMIYDEGNYTDFAEPTGMRVPEEDYAEIEGSDRWTIVAEDAGPGESKWGELMGTEATEVAVFVSVDGSKPAYMLGAQHAIKGENPTSDTITETTNNNFENAMVFTESSFRQFNAVTYHDNPV